MRRKILRLYFGLPMHNSGLFVWWDAACFIKIAACEDASRAAPHTTMRKKNRCSGYRHAMSGPVCQELFLYEIVSEVCGIRPYGQKKGLRWVPKPLLTLNLIPWKTLQIYAYNVTHANISSYFFYILYFLNGIRRLINNWLSYKLFPRLVGRYGGRCGTESVAIPEHSGWDVHRSRVPRKHLKAYPQVTSERNAVEIARPENLTDVDSTL